MKACISVMKIGNNYINVYLSHSAIGMNKTCKFGINTKNKYIETFYCWKCIWLLLFILFNLYWIIDNTTFRKHLYLNFPLIFWNIIHMSWNFPISSVQFSDFKYMHKVCDHLHPVPFTTLKGNFMRIRVVPQSPFPSLYQLLIFILSLWFLQKGVAHMKSFLGSGFF